MAISILYPLYIYRSERCDEEKSSLILIQLHRSFEVRLRSRRESAQLASCGLVSKIAPKPWNIWNLQRVLSLLYRFKIPN